MKYGNGFWVVRDGERVRDRFGPDAYPRTVGFEYGDGTGDRGELLLRDFCVDYLPPGWSNPLRMTVLGNPEPVLRRNAFDFDWASVPALFRGCVCDKADYRVRVASLFHDIGFCVHDVLPGLGIGFWNTMLVEVTEAYCDGRGRDWWLRRELAAGVAAGGPFCWGKTEGELELYRGMFKVEQVPL